jgi:hypothetical protein
MRIRMIILVFLAVLPYHALAQKSRLDSRLLKLESSRGAVVVLIIDGAERPSEN